VPISKHSFTPYEPEATGSNGDHQYFPCPVKIENVDKSETTSLDQNVGQNDILDIEVRPIIYLGIVRFPEA